jgi:carbohydrate-selective porin OprB
MSAKPRVPWTKQRQLEVETARERLRQIVRDSSNARAVLDLSERSSVLMDLIARADVGLDVVLVAPLDRTGPATELTRQWERRYNRTVDIRTSAVGECGAFNDVLAAWDEGDIEAYAQAHRTPRIQVAEQFTDVQTPQARRARLALVGC